MLKICHTQEPQNRTTANCWEGWLCRYCTTAASTMPNSLATEGSKRFILYSTYGSYQPLYDDSCCKQTECSTTYKPQ